MLNSPMSKAEQIARREPRCDECKFSRPMETSNKMLFCCRYPPTNIVTPEGAISMPSHVHPAFWCGEFKSKFSEN